LRAQLDRPHSEELRAPSVNAARASARTSRAGTPAVDQPVEVPALSFANGVGGFAERGHAYVIVLEGAQETPAPWTNVIANPGFGTIVSASGAAHTWAGNSRENRLTSFANDPVADPTSEAWFIRDDESDDVWCPTAGPIPRDAASGRCLIRQSAGLTWFSRAHRGIAHDLQVFVDDVDPVKFSILTLVNRGATPRRLSLFAYNDWVLGAPTDDQGVHVVTRFDDDTEAIVATNAFNAHFAGHVAFAHLSDPVRSATGDRGVFVGRNGTLAKPAGLETPELPARFGAGLDPCAALHVRVDLAPGASHRVLLLLGQATSEENARALIARHGRPDAAAAGLQRSRASWDRTLGAIEVHTPDDSFDVIVNRWLLYQDVSCRLWARSGYNPAGRGVWLSRPAPGRPGPVVRPSRSGAGAHPPGGGPAVPGG
jgi:cyclic beta-1,2-glucan synthetase